MKRASFLLAFLAACSASGTEAGLGPGRFEERRVAMGVDARIVLYAPSRADADRALAAAFARIAALEETLSDWRPQSELSRLNAAAGGGPVVVSQDLFDVLARSLALAHRTAGAFDPTVGPVSWLWREARRDGALPGEDSLAIQTGHVGYSKLRLDADDRTAHLAEPGLRLDLGAIGKGYACDRALETLRSLGFPVAMVQLGGDVAAGDPPPGSEGWRIACGDRELRVANQGIGTSGNSAQHTEIGGVRYSHVVDPRTGRALTHDLTMTVIAPDATMSDALATAANVLGRKEGRAILERFEGVRLIVDDPARKSLFDGRTLDGWTTKGGRYDGNALWTVEDGCIVGRVNEKGEGGLLYTEKPYTSFVFECEVRIDHPFDSGIFVRMVPPDQGLKGAQVTLDDRPDGEIAALYADGFLAHNEMGITRWKGGEWNHVEVRCTGFDMGIDVELNGQYVLTYRNPEGTPGYAPTGLIGIQVHGGMGEPRENAARFREIRIRELPVFGEDAFTRDTGDRPGDPPGPRRLLGWSSLFDGTSLEGWEEHGTSGGWRARDGVLGALFGKGSGELRTKEDFRDFDLRLEFKIARMANSGVFLRAARDGSNPAYSGCEIQILDDFDWETVTGQELKPWQLTGSLYGAVAADAPGLLRPPEEWNRYEILCRGPRLAVALNGRTLYDVDVLSLAADPLFATRAKSGFIGLQRYSCDGPAGEDAVAFRNLFVRRKDP